MQWRYGRGSQEGLEGYWINVRGARSGWRSVGGVRRSQESMEECWIYVRGPLEGLEECRRYNSFIRGSQEELNGRCMDDGRPQEGLGRSWKDIGE